MSNLSRDVLYTNPWKFSIKKDRLSSVIISHLSNVSRNKIGDHNLLTNSYQKSSLNYISRFINKNMKFTHLYMHQKFDNINLIYGAESCFSRIDFLSFNSDINDIILSKLIETCKSIKKLELIIRANNNNYRVVKLIEAQKKLFNVCLVPLRNNDPLFCDILENSLVKHANTIQYFKITERPTTHILSSFINLKGLEIDIPINPLTNLIKNTNGFLSEIIIDDIDHNEVDNKRIITAISRNCSNLKSYILLNDNYFKWGKLFKILTKSSSTSRHPMFLQFIKGLEYMEEDLIGLLEKYKVEGVVKKFDIGCYYKDFEWI
ncbi:hypothetical protein C1646_755370 [Rhizophagus diaphanus]|nr:hypothetical protein C1646_755370 [Rhizophagus diaphanus] [Rhizophagus sp. MUCL 43196]